MINIYLTLSIVFSLIFSYLLVNYFFIKKLEFTSESRVNNIDGLRGYLALGVFIHHYVITYYWHITNKWVTPPQDVITNMGQMSVSLFFMITGFLFFKKIFKNKLDLKKYIVHRMFRLIPLYYVVICIMTLLILIHQNFYIFSSTEQFLDQIFKWMLFQQPTVNTYLDTNKVTAGVTWTLKYEWLFYIFIPFAFYFRRFKILFIILGLFSLYLLIHPKNIQLLHYTFSSQFFILFYLGYIINYLSKTQFIEHTNFDNKYISIVNIVIILTILFAFKTAYGTMQFLLLGIFFASIVFGNSIFGVLSLSYSKFLGEISYSIYLVHGLILYSIFTLILPTLIQEITIYYMLLMPLITITITIISYLSFSYIEKPMIALGKKI